MTNDMEAEEELEKQIADLRQLIETQRFAAEQYAAAGQLDLAMQAEKNNDELASIIRQNEATLEFFRATAE